MADEARCTPLHPENMDATCSDVRELLAPTSFHMVHGGCASVLNVAAPSVIQSDSKSAIDMSLDPVAFKKTKHILRAAEFLRDLVARDVVRLQHLPGKVMVADLLTKAVARALFASLMDLIRQYAESGVACPST